MEYPTAHPRNLAGGVTPAGYLVAIDMALSWHGAPPEKLNRFERNGADLALIATLN
jgi:hypothetical protein